MSLSRDKRAATSPAGESTDEKRQLVDGSFSDSETTTIDSDFLSSTMARGSDSLKSELKSVLCDRDVLETLSKAVAAHVSDALRKEVSSLKTRLEKQDREIMFLNDKVDALQQYDRRNSIRVNGIPEAEGEVTDNIMKKIGEELGVAMTGRNDRPVASGRSQAWRWARAPGRGPSWSSFPPTATSNV